MTEPLHRTRRRVLRTMLGAAATLSVTRLPASNFAPPAPRASASAPANGSPDALAAAASAHFPFGAVVPALAFPSLPLRTNTGLTVDARDWLRGHVTALQLMFTNCSATCPIQGAIFESAQRHLGATLPDFRFVSLSIDPVADSPAALSAWLTGFGAGPEWLAAAPRPDDLPVITALLRGEPGLRSGGQPKASDAHTAQVYYLDRDARLVLRSADFPSALQVAQTLQRLAARSSLSAS